MKYQCRNWRVLFLSERKLIFLTKEISVMQTQFIIKPLSHNTFSHLMQLSQSELAMHNAKWISVDSKPGYPCRVSLAEASVGERVLAIPFYHHDVDSPYRASGPIFVREHANTADIKPNHIPEILKQRLLSLRAYNSKNMMCDAAIFQGEENLIKGIKNFFENTEIAYIHIHNANPGCFNCSVEWV